MGCCSLLTYVHTCVCACACVCVYVCVCKLVYVLCFISQAGVLVAPHVRSHLLPNLYDFMNAYVQVSGGLLSWCEIDWTLTKMSKALFVTNTRTHTHMLIHAHTRACARTYTRTHVHANARTHTCLQTCMYTQNRKACTYLCVHFSIYLFFCL